MGGGRDAAGGGQLSRYCKRCKVDHLMVYNNKGKYYRCIWCGYRKYVVLEK